MRKGLATVAILSVVALTACATSMAQRAGSAGGAVDPGAGAWRTWVLASGKDARVPPPPDAQATATELQHVKAAAGQRDAAALQRIRYWDFWSPSHLWNEILIDVSSANPIPGGSGIRAFAMMNVAIHDALVAAWDSKYAHNRRHPAEMDGQLATVVAVPRSPSYPCEHSVAAGAASAVIAHIYPKEAQRVTAAAEEAARSRVQAGAAFPSDTKAGLDLGRAVATRVIEHMKIEAGQPTTPVPSGPGLWKGTNPVGVNEVTWRRFVLASPSQFRPGPPPAPDSPALAAELAEVKKDIDSGWEIGRRVGEAVVDRAKRDGS